MKIACITPSRIPSKTANSIQVMKVCQAMAQIGHEVRLWAPGAQKYPWSELSASYGLSTPFEVTWQASQPALKRYDLSLMALKAAADWHADLVYTWLPQVSLIALMRKMSVVLEVHDRPTGQFGPWLLKQTVKHTGKKRIAVITHALAKVLQKEFRLEIRPDDLVIAPNGVDLERFEALPEPHGAREQLGLPVEPITAVYTGHLYAGRGVELIFGLAKAFPQVNFLLVGGNLDSVESSRQAAAAAGLHNITFTGFIPNQRLPLFQAAGDILLMPYGQIIAGSSGGNSADICSPMKMFEYLATGRAILCSDLPVFHEVLNEQNTAFCRVDELESWVAGLNLLLREPEIIQKLGQQAKIDAQRYSWKTRASAILRTLE